MISIPPLGLFGWANPITAAGMLLPNTGWFGLLATLLLMISICYIVQGIKTSYYFLGALGIFLATYKITYQELPQDQETIALNTELGWIRGINNEYEHNIYLIEKVSEVISEHKKQIKLILLPELVIGTWNGANKHLWGKLNRRCQELGITILLGGKIDIRPNEYLNGLIAIGKEEGLILLDRIPVPISMWRPWDKTNKTASSYWSHSGIHNINSNRVATAICYEQLLIWPILYSMINKPELLLASSNVWGAKNTNIPAIQQQVIKAWGRLFNVAVLIAVNK